MTASYDLTNIPSHKEEVNKEKVEESVPFSSLFTQNFSVMVVLLQASM